MYEQYERRMQRIAAFFRKHRITFLIGFIVILAALFVIFGVGIGFLTMMIRYFGSYPEGVSFAILIMNSVVPLLNMWFKQKKYGRA